MIKHLLFEAGSNIIHQRPYANILKKMCNLR